MVRSGGRGHGFSLLRESRGEDGAGYDTERSEQREGRNGTSTRNGNHCVSP